MSQHTAIFALVAFCLSTIAVVEADFANREFLEQQKTVYQLLWHVDQPEMVPELYALGKSYSIEDNLADYTNETYVREFLWMYKEGMLPRGGIFSVFYPTMRDQAVALFRVFYYAKDFPTLVKTAAWARIYVNEGLFVYAFSVAVTHHKSTQHIRVPAHHEIYPHLYFDDGIIRQAYNAKISTGLSGDWTIIPERNHSFPHTHYPDYQLRYFTEDIAVNDLPYYAHLAHPFWMSAEEFDPISPRRGEVYFWAYRAEYARYCMERLANDMGEVQEFDWHQRIPYDFFPSMSYHNGFSLPHRVGYSYIPSHNYKQLKALRDYEYRISEAIDMGYVLFKNGTHFPIHNSEGIYTLGNLIEGNADSVNYDLYGNYDRLGKTLLGFTPEPYSAYQVFPTMMQQYGLNFRDPIYWSWTKKILGFYEQFVSKLPKYTNEELAFPGVRIESASVDRVTTYFTPYDYFISGAVKLHNPEDSALIKARKLRLAHKPYSYTIKVVSESDAPKTTIRTFLGPKYDVHHKPIPTTEIWNKFFLVDEWIVDLKAGTNEFTRNTAAHIGGADEVSEDIFYAKILSALAGNETYEVPEHLYTFPERMIMPKGKREGFPMQFLFFISPYNHKDLYRSGTPVLGNKYLVDAPLGWPLDRPVYSNFTELPNAHFEEFNVYYLDESEINASV